VLWLLLSGFSWSEEKIQKKKRDGNLGRKNGAILDQKERVLLGVGQKGGQPREVRIGERPFGSSGGKTSLQKVFTCFWCFVGLNTWSGEAENQSWEKGKGSPVRVWENETRDTEKKTWKYRKAPHCP